MLEPLYTAAEMRAAEERYPGFPDTAGELIERAGSAVAAFVLERFGHARSVTVVCGTGANGADGRIAARALVDAGRDVTIIVGERKELGSPELVVDALFGTGFSGEPRAPAAALIDLINGAGVPVVSVDLPSGVDATTGEVAGAAVRASHTVTFHAPKVGLLVAPGRFHAGELVVAEIGLEHSATEHRRVSREIVRLVPRRGPRDTKYTAGSLLVVGGSRGMTGALCLAALAAFRSDAGYVAVAVPEDALPAVEVCLLEAVKRPLEQAFEAVERASALALGPGLGRSAERRELVSRLLRETELPAVVDADALDRLEPVDRSAAIVLTPHAGELARLLGEETEWVFAHRLEAARRAAERFHAVCLLKGADTIIAAPGEGALVCDLGTPALATAGSGDVLTGILGALLAKGMEARLAAAAAAALHGLAAELAEHQAGLVASDLIANLPAAFDAAAQG